MFLRAGLLALTIGALVACGSATDDREWMKVNEKYSGEDFNRDVKAVIMWLHVRGHLGLWFMDVTTQTGAVAVGPNPGTAWQDKDTADFNGDGKAESMTQHDSGQLGVWI